MNIFIAGATSAIAVAWARLRAEQGASFFLVARSAEKLQAVRDDLLVRGAQQVHCTVLDMSQSQDYGALTEQVYRCFSHIDVALFAQGSMPTQRQLELDVSALHALFEVNVISCLQSATLLTQRMAQVGKGSIVLISSPSGDRGRQSNYFYGASKAAVSVFASGLRNQMTKKGVQVLTVKPGFVDTPMTAAMDKSGPLWAQPEQIARCIESGILKKRNEIYAPWFWQCIMFIIKHIPEPIFKKLSL
ncbi:MAG: SDR family oxidoreductase [Pseudomonadales bacterium]|nr:SDR family oxidoreductase [Pseudomonadales bacterium]